MPFLLAAFMIEQFSAVLTWLKRHLIHVERTMGVLMVLTGQDGAKATQVRAWPSAFRAGWLESRFRRFLAGIGKSCVGLLTENKVGLRRNLSKMPTVANLGCGSVGRKSPRGLRAVHPFGKPTLEEMPMNASSKSGAAIAAAAATFFLAGATMSTPSYAASNGHCIGANACKGQSACKGGNHSCKGLNACKGQGFAAMTKSQCSKAKGEFEPS